MTGAPLLRSLPDECQNALSSLQSFLSGPNPRISPRLLAQSYGLVVFTVYRIGFIHSFRAGQGLLLSHDPTRPAAWSFPSAFAVGGTGIGLQAGLDRTQIVIICNTAQAMESFKASSVTLGSNASMSLGPAGTAAENFANLSMNGQVSVPMCEGYI